MPAWDIKLLMENRGVPTQGCYDKAELINRLINFEVAKPAMEEPNELFLEEKEIPFSMAPQLNLVLAGLLGAVNLGGALWLGGFLEKAVFMYGPNLPSVLGLSKSLYGLIVTYAVGFNLIPGLRYLWVKEQNMEIGKRNSVRRQFAKILSRAGGPLYDKLLAARKFKSKVKVIKDRDVEYTTAKPASEQRDPAEEDLRAFDKKMS